MSDQNTLHISNNQSAKLAGIAYLLTFAIVVFANFGIYNKLVVPGNAMETAHAIAANEWLFRTGILLDLAYAAGFIILTGSLYSIFERVNRKTALVALLFHLIYVMTWMAFTLKFFDAIRFADGAKYLQVFSNEQLASFSRLLLNARFDRYYGPLMFYSIGSTIYSYLWYKSAYIPKLLSVWGIIACTWCTLCAIAYLANPDFGRVVNPWLFDLPMAFFDMVLSGWLLTKGLKKNNSH